MQIHDKFSSNLSHSLLPYRLCKDVQVRNHQLWVEPSMKLLSGVAGLKLLGADYHYWTGIFMRGTVGNEGTLNGDVAGEKFQRIAN